MGITILGGLVLLAALVLAIAGLAGMFLSFASLIPGSQIPGANLFVGGLIFFVIAIILGIAGGGLLRLKAWAWWLATLVTLGALAYYAYGVYRDVTDPQGAGISITSAVTLGIIGLIFVYLLSVSGRFRRPEPAVKTT